MKFIKYFCVIAFAFGINAEVIANTQKVLSAAGLAVNEDIKVEFGEGIGETKDEALKEAIRDVLQRVVGTYVDSDFRVENDKIIKDQIITHSNGFIERYKIMDTDQAPDGRGIQVTIKAWVKIRDFVNRMKGVAPIQRVKVDGLLLNNELENKHSAEKLIQKEFEQLNPVNDLLKASLVTSIKPIVQESSDDSVTLRYIFTIEYSYENYYKKFLPRMMSVLDQVAVKPPQNRGIQAKMVPIKQFPMGALGEYDVFKDVSVSGYCLMYDPEMLRRRDKNMVSAIIKINNTGLVTLKEWSLTKRLKILFMDSISKVFYSNGVCACTLRLLDANGEELTQGRVQLPTGILFVDFFDGLSYGGNYASFLQNARHPNCSAPELAPVMKCSFVAIPDQVGDAMWQAWEKFITRGTAYGITGDRKVMFDKIAAYIDVVIDRNDIARIKTAEIKLEQSKISEY